MNHMQSAQLMQKATKASRPLPSSVLRESFRKALEILEDSPTEGLIESMRMIAGVAMEEELFSDYKLLQSSLRQILGDETADTILTFLHDEIVNGFPHSLFFRELLTDIICPSVIPWLFSLAKAIRDWL